MINSEMLWTGSMALWHANGNAGLGWTDPPPAGRHAGLGDPAATTTARVSTPTAPAPTQKITVYLLDDHEIVRLGLKDLLESEGDIQVIGESGSVAHAQTQIPALQPQVAVLDSRLPDGSGIDVSREIRSRDPNIAVLILTSYDEPPGHPDHRIGRYRPPQHHPPPPQDQQPDSKINWQLRGGFRLKELRARIIEINELTQYNLLTGEALGLIRGMLIDLVEASDADPDDYIHDLDRLDQIANQFP